MKVGITRDIVVYQCITDTGGSPSGDFTARITTFQNIFSREPPSCQVTMGWFFIVRCKEEIMFLLLMFLYKTNTTAEFPHCLSLSSTKFSCQRHHSFFAKLLDNITRIFLLSLNADSISPHRSAPTSNSLSGIHNSKPSDSNLGTSVRMTHFSSSSQYTTYASYLKSCSFISLTYPFFSNENSIYNF